MTNAATAMEPAQQSNARTIETMLQSMSGAMAEALPKHVTPDRMIRIALTALRTSKDLRECTPASFLAAVLVASMMGLEVNTPAQHAYLVPFNKTIKERGKPDRVVKECTLITGYQGKMELARRSGQVRLIQAFAVHEGDEFAWQLGLNPDIRHHVSADPQRSDKPLTHAYAIARLTHGDPVFVVLTRGDIEYYRGKSKAKDSNFWVNNFIEMALKTTVHRLYTWLPRSSEMAVSYEAENRDGLRQVHAAPDVAQLLQRSGFEIPEDSEPEDDEASPAVVPAALDGKRTRMGEPRNVAVPATVAKSEPPPGRQPGDD